MKHFRGTRLPRDFSKFWKKFKAVNSRGTRGRISLYPGTARIYSFILLRSIEYYFFLRLEVILLWRLCTVGRFDWVRVPSREILFLDSGPEEGMWCVGDSKPKFWVETLRHSEERGAGGAANHRTSHLLQRGTSYSGQIKISISSLQMSLTEYRGITTGGSLRAFILAELQPPNTAMKK